MASPIKNPATYADIEALPPHVVGELIDGDLIATRRGAFDYCTAASTLCWCLGAPMSKGRSAHHKDWIILPKLELRSSTQILVPDISAWSIQVLGTNPEATWQEGVPHWVCEFDGAKAGSSRVARKMEIYGALGVSTFWLVNLGDELVQSFRNDKGVWHLVDEARGNTTFYSPPFENIPIELGSIWSIDWHLNSQKAH